MQTGICHIVGAGENYGINFEPGTKDLVIAVDAGFRLLEQKAVRIDLAIGDFDTLQYIPKHSNVIALKAEKDDTDMLAAVREGIRAGYSLLLRNGRTSGSYPGQSAGCGSTVTGGAAGICC